MTKLFKALLVKMLNKGNNKLFMFNVITFGELEDGSLKGAELRVGGHVVVTL